MGLTLGIFVGLLNLVPYLQIAGFLPAFLLTVIKSVETDSPLWVAVLMTAAVFVAVQIIQDMIITPYIMGKNTGLNPAIILLSLSVWGKILGFLGLILAIPFTCLVITYYSEYIAKQSEKSQEKEIT
jgi:predicted PurR-regulated permease PerM